MAPFSSPRDRDAWATIRGFVYQVDLTIARWLELDDLQALELEAGEDIDLVASALVADDTRELEQVKVRAGGLSLRSGEAIEAIGNARTHLAANPTILLRFRFTTTAHVAREQGHPDPGRPAGIDLWEGARTGTRGHNETAGDIGVIQTLLASASRPKSLPAPLWDAAQAVAADPAALADLVGRFEWSMGALSPEDRSKSVLAALVAGGYVENEPRARAVYERLFAFVFRLLTREGTKRLTKGELGTVIARSDLTESERALLSRVRDRLALVQVRVEALEGRVDRLEEKLASAFGLPGAAIALGVPGLDVEPPPLADPLSERTQVVAALKEIASPWLALEGEAGTSLISPY